MHNIVLLPFYLLHFNPFSTSRSSLRRCRSVININFNIFVSVFPLAPCIWSFHFKPNGATKVCMCRQEFITLDILELCGKILCVFFLLLPSTFEIKFHHDCVAPSRSFITWWLRWTNFLGSRYVCTSHAIFPFHAQRSCRTLHVTFNVTKILFILPCSHLGLLWTFNGLINPLFYQSRP